MITSITDAICGIDNVLNYEDDLEYGSIKTLGQIKQLLIEIQGDTQNG